ncbi:MAG: V-type ATP synthase subunit E [Bacillota bacterium]
MSGADKIIEKIMDDARKISEETVEKARSNAEELIAMTVTNAEKEASAQLQKSEKEAAEIKRRMMSVAELDGRKSLLSCKQQVIEEAFDAAKETLAKLEAEPYRALLEELILENAQGGDEILCAEKDASVITDDFIAAVNQKLAQAGKGGVSLSAQRVNIAGGFVLRSQTMERNCSFEALLRMVREEAEPDVAAILFQ